MGAMTNKSDFFGCVAKHNLERFHSECIVWAFNNSKEMLECFIKKTAQNPDLNIEVARAFSETSDIDILIYYKSEGNNYLIHVENKVKASEGKKKITKKILAYLKKYLTIEKFKEINNLKRDYLSQTEYYYLRDKSKITDRITEVLSLKNKIKTTEYSWSYVYLVPALGMTTDNSRNTWSESFDKPNPWVNLSYADIFNCMPEKTRRKELTSDKETTGVVSDNIIFNEYKAHLEKEFISSHKCIITLKDHKVDTSKEDTLSFQNLNLMLDEDEETTILDASGMQIHFLKLKDSLTNFCDDNIKDYKFEVEFVTETGNNGGYLIQAQTTIKLENPNPDIFEETNPIDFRIGFQFEQNEKDEGKFKFYFADLLYEPKLIINEKTRNKPPAKTQHPTYNKAVKQILINVFSENYLNEALSLEDGEKLSFNGSKSLSFCSFLSDYRFKNSNEIEQKFKDEIHHLIARIKDKSLAEHIQLLSK